MGPVQRDALSADYRQLLIHAYPSWSPSLLSIARPSPSTHPSETAISGDAQSYGRTSRYSVTLLLAGRAVWRRHTLCCWLPI